MILLNIVTPQRRRAAQVKILLSGTIEVAAHDPVLRQDLEALIAQAGEYGLDYETSAGQEENGEWVVLSQAESVNVGNERFPAALAEAINKHNFSGRRYFAIRAR